MSASPFFTLPIRGKRDVLLFRQRARQVACLLRFEAREQACIAAGAFAVADQALGRLGKAQLCFQIEQSQLHIFAQGPGIPRDGPPEARKGNKPLLRLVKDLPKDSGPSETDLGWLIAALVELAPAGLFEEVARQNQEVLALLCELQTCHNRLKEKEEATPDPSAA